MGYYRTMKKESKELRITDTNGNTEVATVEINPEFPHYAIKAFGIRFGHELGGELVGTEVLGDGNYEVREYHATSEAQLLNGTSKAGRLLATIKVA